MKTEKSKHTPGPWRIAGNYVSNGCPGDGAGRGAICQMANSLGAAVYAAPVASLEDSANARLIAAAPELLEALAIAEAWISDTQLDFDLTDNGTLESVRAAIAKAKGE